LTPKSTQEAAEQAWILLMDLGRHLGERVGILVRGRRLHLRCSISLLLCLLLQQLPELLALVG